ncbi:hypothetical protein MN608_00053 [Microdochium nivale]|nr:hypothetical protein MN608_00053 [Microdochium nivale]
MDTGFDVDCPAVRQELRLTDRPVKPADKPATDRTAPSLHNIAENSYIVPKDIAMGTDIPSSIIVPGRPLSPTTRGGHGTQLASLALGTWFGIAPRAVPYLVKVNSMAWNTTSRGGDGWQYGQGSDPA